jgi:fatty-acyl-CoA synthase
LVRVGTTLPLTDSFKVIKRQHAAEGTACTDPVHPIERARTS